MRRHDTLGKSMWYLWCLIRLQCIVIQLYLTWNNIVTSYLFVMPKDESASSRYDLITILRSSQGVTEQTVLLWQPWRHGCRMWLLMTNAVAVYNKACHIDATVVIAMSKIHLKCHLKKSHSFCWGHDILIICQSIWVVNSTLCHTLWISLEMLSSYNVLQSKKIPLYRGSTDDSNEYNNER